MHLFPTERPGFVLQGPPHKCALIFADNSGIDIILGVFPFVRELLFRGTEVSEEAVWVGPLPWASPLLVGLALLWASGGGRIPASTAGRCGQGWAGSRTCCGVGCRSEPGLQLLKPRADPSLLERYLGTDVMSYLIHEVDSGGEGEGTL
jgi:hypothetical protein